MSNEVGYRPSKENRAEWLAEKLRTLDPDGGFSRSQLLREAVWELLLMGHSCRWIANDLKCSYQLVNKLSTAMACGETMENVCKTRAK